jgi:2'-5' RNA ligase
VSEPPAAVEHTGDEMLRLFVAIELPADWRHELVRRRRLLERRLGEAADALRWVGEEALHLTLVFLGNVPAAREPAVHAAIATALASTPRLTLTLADLGTFGGQRPRVLWNGIGGDLDALSRLHARLAAGLQPGERARFSPHITLARVREGRQIGVEPRAALANWPRGGPEPFTVQGVSLIRSRLLPGGPVYTRRLLVPLISG